MVRALTAQRFLAAAIAFAGGGACGDNVPRCDFATSDYLNDYYCRNSEILALRYGTSLVRSADEVEYYYDLLKPMWRDAPLSRMAETSIWGTGYNNVSVFTTNTILVEPWSQGDLWTGNESVDGLFAENGAQPHDIIGDGHLVHGAGCLPPLDTCQFSIDYETPLNQRLLKARVEAILTDTTIYLGDPVPNDITLWWAGGTLEVRLVVGWGDCFVACEWLHEFHARISGGNLIAFEDLGGDPIPQNFIDAAMSSRPPL